MKRIILLLPFLLGFFIASAQYDIVERKFGENFMIKDLIADQNGYFVLGYESSEEQIGNQIETYYTAILYGYDRNFQLKWEQRFKRGEWPTLKNLERVNDRIYLTGITPSRPDQYAWLICMSTSGTKLWEKEYGYSGQNTIEGLRVFDAGNGDLILQTHSFKYENSVGRPAIYRLHSDGSVVWQKIYGAQFRYPYFQNGEFTDDGNIVFVGFNYATDQELRAETGPNGYAAKINIANGAIIWEKSYSNERYMYLTGIVPLENGELGVCSGSGNNQASKHATAWKISSEGQIVQKIDVPHDGNGSLWSITRNNKTGEYYAVGSGDIDSERKYNNTTILAIFDRNFEFIDALIIDTGAGTHIVQDIDDGVIAMGFNKLLFIR